MRRKPRCRSALSGTKAAYSLRNTSLPIPRGMKSSEVRRSSRNYTKSFAGVDGLAFLGQDPLNRAAFGRANFVLHFHGFDNEQALAGFDMFSFFDEKAHHFAGHRRKDLLPALGFDAAVAAAAPGARIDDLGDEVLPAGLKFQFAVRRRRYGDFKGLAAQQNGENVGGDLDGVDGYRLAIQHHPPSGGSVFEFDNACIFSRWRSELDLVFHGRRSSCSRRPSSFQREGRSAEEDTEACFSDWLACQIAAAMTAASETVLPR